MAPKEQSKSEDVKKLEESREQEIQKERDRKKQYHDLLDQVDEITRTRGWKAAVCGLGKQKMNSNRPQYCLPSSSTNNFLEDKHTIGEKTAVSSIPCRLKGNVLLMVN